MDTKEMDSLQPVREMVRACIQCGTCAASCPNAFAMDHTPRKMWRMVLAGQTNAIFNTKTFILCSACYWCTLRCPRGLPLTEAMAALKQIAAAKGIVRFRQSESFYKNFMDSVRRYGRVRETEFMSYWFADMKTPVLPIKFMPLGLKLMKKRKVSMQIPSRGPGRFDAMFRKAEELEGDR